MPNAVPPVAVPVGDLARDAARAWLDAATLDVTEEPRERTVPYRILDARYEIWVDSANVVYRVYRVRTDLNRICDSAGDQTWCEHWLEKIYDRDEPIRPDTIR